MRTVREALAGIGLLCSCTYPAAHWNDLPYRVPIHFDLAGRPDGFGPKSALLVLPAMAIFLYLVLSVVARFPAYFNFPVSVTARNRQALRGLAVDMIGWLKAEVMCVFGWLTFAAISTAEGHRSGLGAGFTPAALTVVAATIVWFWYRMLQTRSMP